MEENVIKLTFPIGRLVLGSVHTGKGTDDFNGGIPYTYKSGPKAGQQKFMQWFLLAITKRKSDEKWESTKWGKELYDLGAKIHPKVYKSPTFSWKITDGDSDIPNSKGKAPCEREGYKNHWVLSFRQWSPTENSETPIYTRDGKGRLEAGVKVNCGDYIQVSANIKDNNSPNKPGLLLAQRAISYCAFGDRIIQDDLNPTEEFGKDELPEGAKPIETGYDENL